jgi:sugar phosphate isomerase/epimerase
MPIRLGLMTHHIPRPTVDEVAAAIAGYGIYAVQLNLESAGLDPLPKSLDSATCRRIAAAFVDRGIEIAAVSGTFNAIHPDRAEREEGIRRLGLLAARCADLNTRVITLCTGTRNPDHMWRHHPDNAKADAWRDCLETLQALAKHAERHDVTLAFEPETVNVVDSAAKASVMMEEVGSPRVQVCLDPANLFHPAMLPQMREVLERAFRILSGRIALAHAKDVRLSDRDPDECVRPAAGTGVLDYATYARLLTASGYSGALVMHSLSEAEVPAAKAHVERYFGSALA